jgi:hypothetical protein
MDSQENEMGLGKLVITFILVALFAMTAIGMAAMAQADKPLDSYYSMPNHTVSGSSNLVGTMFATTSNLMIPMILIAGILVLMGGFVILRKG